MNFNSQYGYVKAIGDSDYNLSYNDFTVEFFLQRSNYLTNIQTLFEITNNESNAATLYQKTRFLVLLENNNINAYVIQIISPFIISANTNSFLSPVVLTDKYRIFYNGSLLQHNQYEIENGTRVTIINTPISITNTLIEIGEILVQVNGQAVSENNNHYISAERYKNSFYLFLDGTAQNAGTPAFCSIPSQYLVFANNPSIRILQQNHPALLTIGANRDGLDPFIGKFGDFKITNGLSQHIPAAKKISSISSTFDDSALGTRAADINIEGSGFVNNIESFSPEEQIPAQLFDTLQISVYQSDTSNLNSNIIGFNIFKSSILSGPIGSYEFVTGNNNSFTKVPWTSMQSGDASVLVNGVPIPASDWNLSKQVINITGNHGNVKIFSTGPTSYFSIGANGASTLTSNIYPNSLSIGIANVFGFVTPNIGSILNSHTTRGQVFINQECITYLYIDRVNNIISGLQRGVSGTGIPPMHLANSQVISAGYDRNLQLLTNHDPGINVWYSNVSVPDSLQNTNSIISAILIEQGTYPPKTPF